MIDPHHFIKSAFFSLCHVDYIIHIILSKKVLVSIIRIILSKKVLLLFQNQFRQQYLNHFYLLVKIYLERVVCTLKDDEVVNMLNASDMSLSRSFNNSNGVNYDIDATYQLNMHLENDNFIGPKLLVQNHDVKINNDEIDISFDDSFDRIHTVIENVKKSVYIHFNEL